MALPPTVTARDVFEVLALAKDTFGFLGKKEAPVADKPLSVMSPSELIDKIDDLPRRDELATAFAVLQAGIDRQNQTIRRIVVVGFSVNLIAILILLGFLVSR